MLWDGPSAKRRVGKLSMQIIRIQIVTQVIGINYFTDIEALLEK